MAWLMAQIQVVIAFPFVASNPMGYLSRAFELSRQFKFEWTVNWRMLGEEMFLSRQFATTLLISHVAILMAFIVARWLRPAEVSLATMIPEFLSFRSPFTPEEEIKISGRITPEYVMTTILSANVIGLLFARSLHYQFYAYLAWTTPYLLWRACPNPMYVPVLWGVQEMAWNVFPSTDVSSATVVNILAITVVMVYFRTEKDFEYGAKAKADAVRAEKKKK